jgi:hypothetical protein
MYLHCHVSACHEWGWCARGACRVERALPPDQKPQRWAVSLPRDLPASGSADDPPMAATKLSVKAANLRVLSGGGAEKEGIAATLWAINSRGSLVCGETALDDPDRPPSVEPDCWEPVRPLPYDALMMCRARHLLATAPQSCCNNGAGAPASSRLDRGARCDDGVRAVPAPAAHAGVPGDERGEDPDAGGGRPEREGEGAGRGCERQAKQKREEDGASGHEFGRDELLAVAPAADSGDPQARDHRGRESTASCSEQGGGAGNPDHAGGSGGATRESDRLWHSKHFVWYRLPHLQRLKDSTLVDGVFGPTLDQSKGPGVAEDALLLEVFYDSDSGKLFLEVRRPLCPSWRPL